MKCAQNIRTLKSYTSDYERPLMSIRCPKFPFFWMTLFYNSLRIGNHTQKFFCTVYSDNGKVDESQTDNSVVKVGWFDITPDIHCCVNQYLKFGELLNLEKVCIDMAYCARSPLSLSYFTPINDKHFERLLLELDTRVNSASVSSLPIFDCLRFSRISDVLISCDPSDFNGSLPLIDFVFKNIYIKVKLYNPYIPF